MKPEISIIVPVYNVEKWIVRCLDSLKNQSFDNYEVILVNDGTKDESGNICQEYIKKYKLSNKFYYYEKENGGLSDARNFGLKYANGKYVCFLDSDDYVDLDLYKKMIEATKVSDYKIVECEFYYTFEKKEIIEHLPKKYTTIKDYLVNSSVVAWNKIYNRLWLLESNVLFPKGLQYEDINFFFKLCTNLNNTNEIYTINEPLIHYVQRENSITNKPGIRMLEIIDIYSDVIDYLKLHNKYNVYKNEVEYKMIRNLFCSFLRKAKLIDDKETRKKVIDNYIFASNDLFPNWKKNLYLNRFSIVNIYLKIVNKKIIYRIANL